MSASREKKLRKEVSDRPGLSAKQLQERQDAFRRRVVTVIAAVLLFALIFLILSGSGVMSGMTALTIDGVKISAAELNFHYYTAFEELYYLYYSYGLLDQLGIDPDISFKKQYAGEETWAEYFEDSAIQSLKRIVALSEAAKREGITLNEDDKADIKEAMDNMEVYASQQGLKVNRYLSNRYGRGLTLEKYEEILERFFLSDRYTKAKVEAFNWNDQDFEAYYQENREKYDFIDYHTFTIKGTPSDQSEREEPYTEEELEAYKEEQRGKANEMLSRVTASEAFFALSREYTADPVEDEDNEGESGEEEETDTTLIEKLSVGSVSETLKEYLTSTSRAKGDKTVIENGDDFVVILFLNRYREEGPFTEAEVKAEADRIYAEWLAGDADEDSFAELARLHTADGNGEEGGIYEGVYPGQMVAEFNDWCFDPSRQPGDHGIVKTEFGQHIMYFVGVNETNQANIDIRHILIKSGGWKAKVKSDLDSETYQELLSELTDDLEPKRSWLGMIFTKEKSASKAS
ncbi:MAG: peptidylprolyl isomerase [Oscillospiraceae bacterium]|nr:peptidylprolyl isomerase [Oscillospiraceae bacterium]